MTFDPNSDYRKMIEPLCDVRSMPTGLAARLRSIPTSIADVQEWQGDDPDLGFDAATLDLVSALGSARRSRALPTSLAERLRALPARSDAERLPRWISDSRWATAACVLLTAALSLAAGDASATFQRSTGVVSTISVSAISTPVESFTQRMETWRLKVLEPWASDAGQQLVATRGSLGDRLGLWLEDVDAGWQSLNQDFVENSAGVAQWVTTALQEPSSTWTELWSGDQGEGK